MSDPEPPVWLAPISWVAVVCMYLSSAGALAVWATDLKPDDKLALSLTALGVAVALGTVSLAAMIFKKQYAHAEANNSATSQKFSNLEDGLKRVLDRATKVPLSKEELEAETDEVPGDEAEEDAHVPSANISWVGTEPGRSVAAGDVPLSILANLVWGWRLEPATRRNDGRWTVENLRGAWRPDSKATDGRGNMPWYVSFENSDGDLRIWRVFRGGKNKPEPTVRDVTDEVDR